MGPTLNNPRIRPIAALVGLVLILAACTSAGGASTAPGAASSPAASTAPVSAAPSTGGGGYGRGGNDDYGTTPSKAPASAGTGTVEVVASSGAVGPFLTGANGATLYTFKPDSANTSTCVDACVGNWPPFTVGAGGSVKAGAGVTGALTTFARPDGTMQVAYDGRPLYYFSGDAKAGDTNGQGLGNNWFVAAP